MTTELEPLDFPETVYPSTAPLQPLVTSTGTHPADPLVVALNRLAAAIEEQNRNRSHLAAPAAPQGNLADLPQPNPQRPVCPRHGIDNVKPSTKRGTAFFCSAKDPNGPRGYCTFTVPA